MTTTTDRSEGQAWLAEHVSAPYTVDYPKGSKRWLLRRECPCIYREHDRHECYPCYRSNQHIQSGDKVCWRCKGSDYVYNDAEDALTEAIRAKGWNVSIHMRADDGDWVQIFSPATLEVLSRVYAQEGLRGRHAIEVCFRRAEENV